MPDYRIYGAAGPFLLPCCEMDLWIKHCWEARELLDQVFESYLGTDQAATRAVYRPLSEF